MLGVAIASLVLIAQAESAKTFEYLDDHFLLTFEKRAHVARGAPILWILEFQVVPGLECFPIVAKQVPALKDFPAELTKELRSENTSRRSAALMYVASLASMSRSAVWARERDEGEAELRRSLGEYAKPIRLALEANFGESNRDNAINAAATMLALDSNHPQALARLVTELSAKEPSRRKAACTVVEGMRLSNAKIVEHLSKAIVDQDPDVRLAAARAAWKIGPKAAKTVPALIEFLKTGDAAYDEDVRPFGTMAVLLRGNVALLALGEMGPDAKPAVPALLTMLGSKDSAKCQSVLECLAFIGPAAREAVPILDRRLAAESADLKFYKCATILRIDPAHKQALEVISAGLKSADEKTRDEAFRAAANLAPRIASLIPLLIKGLQDPAEPIRKNAMYALGAMGKLAEPAIPALVDILNDDKLVFQLHAQSAHALGSIGIASLPALTKIIESDMHRVRGFAAHALGVLGKDGGKAVPVLIKALSEPELQMEAAVALGRLRQLAAPAKGALTRVSQKGATPEARIMAAWALTQID